MDQREGFVLRVLNEEAPFKGRLFDLITCNFVVSELFLLYFKNLFLEKI